MLATLLGYAFTAVTLFLALALFLSLRRELAARQSRAKETWDELAASLERLRSEVEALRPPAPRPGLNLQKRSEALRLHRQGRPPARIAAELGMPANEVELLIKVHRLVLSGAAATAPLNTGERPAGPATG